jgi:hypothetical protein
MMKKKDPRKIRRSCTDLKIADTINLTYLLYEMFLKVIERISTKLIEASIL